MNFSICAIDRPFVKNNSIFPLFAKQGLLLGRIITYSISVSSNLLKSIYDLVIRLFYNRSTITRRKTKTEPCNDQIHSFRPTAINQATNPIKPYSLADYLNNPELISNLGILEEKNYQIKNTKLIHILADFTFGTKDHYESNKSALDDLLNRLTNLALKGNLLARNALICPNNPELILSPQYIANGFPQNTPLALLVKMGNVEGCRTILPVYDAPELLFKNPRGNTVLHFAVATGQMEIAFAIIHRAAELNILDQLLNTSNSVGKTADDALKAILVPTSKNYFTKHYKVADEIFGGEEINKALTCQDSIFLVRNKLVQGVKGANPSKIKDKTLLELFRSQ
jgi:hypothetical protein